MTATTVYHAPTPVPLCTTRDPRMWDLGNPGNDEAQRICRRCPFLAACEPGPDEHPVGVIRAGRAYAESKTKPGAALAPHHDEIAQLLGKGWSAARIAKRFGVSNTTAYSYLSTHFPHARRATSSPYRGVTWHSPSQRWITRISVDGRKRHLGTFDDEIAAARAYDTFARRIGRPLNFPDDAA